ncbi:hypothetical protein [Actinomadura parmotrematis]|uniref:DUF4288 domain-containing protein n=1 Tax=Actinomadura parmotrematis TaxID=2864039 RepID=A0ABS7G093_9ACTN|nr:hypothetical protein [Actinomadura parmotrematis]MBW8485610.1 hypothetical protein [Actinomadura parmotrematis]
MADVYEVLVSANLPSSLSGEDLAELRRRLGLDGGGGGGDEAVLGADGAAHRIGGALYRVLVEDGEGPGSGWALAARQEVHAEDLDEVGEFLRWLEGRAGRLLCHARFYEEEDFTRVEDGDFHLGIDPED